MSHSNLATLNLVFSSMTDVLPSTFKPILNLTLILAISSPNCLLQHGSLNYFQLAIAPTLLHTNLSPAHKWFFSSSKFFTLILQIILLISETVFLTFKASIPCSEGIGSLLFSCTSFFSFSEYHHFHVTHKFPPYHHRLQNGFALIQFQFQVVHLCLQLGHFQSTIQEFHAGSLLFTSRPLFQLLTTF